MLGQEVASIVSEELSTGQYNYNWDASDFSSGVYVYKLETSGYVDTKKLIVLK